MRLDGSRAAPWPDRKGGHIRAAFVLPVALAAVGCAKTLVVERTLPSTPPTPGDEFVAGMAKVDLTPTPGLSTFGWSLLGADAKGYRSRLHARAFYLEDAGGDAVALVACDLGAVSRLLHHRVASLVAEPTGLGLGQILLAATHTHAGPGGYLGTAFYDRFGASSAGFDSRVVDFLAERIATAIIRAHTSRAPARLGVAQHDVWRLSRNRSLQAARANPSSSLPSPPPGLSAEQRFVDPTFTVLRVDAENLDGHLRPLGAFANFGVHPTVVSGTDDETKGLYHGDTFGVASRRFEWNVCRAEGATFERVAFALTNGAEGDVQAPYEKRDFDEARRWGGAIADSALVIYRALEGRGRGNIDILTGYREAPVRLPDGGAVADGVCPEARPGGALLYGSEESRATELAGIVREPWAYDEPRGCHGYKRPPDGPLRVAISVLTERDHFPDRLVLQAIVLGDLLLVTVPGEATSEMGARIKHAARRAADTNGALGGRVRRVALVGLANDYVSYITTPEEYDAQHYEGGSTLYGRGTGTYIAEQVAELVAGLGGEAVEPDARAVFRHGFTRIRPRDGRGEINVRASRTHTTVTDSSAWFTFEGHRDILRGRAPMVWIERAADDVHHCGEPTAWRVYTIDGEPVDDRSDRFTCRYRRPDPVAGPGTWKATLGRDARVKAGVYRFVAQPVLHDDRVFSACFRVQHGRFEALPLEPVIEEEEAS